eukprot:SAG22_NODE_126_length_18820_cov_10.207788_13_plen_122_part_00
MQIRATIAESAEQGSSGQGLSDEKLERLLQQMDDPVTVAEGSYGQGYDDVYGENPNMCLLTLLDLILCRKGIDGGCIARGLVFSVCCSILLSILIALHAYFFGGASAPAASGPASGGPGGG